MSAPFEIRRRTGLYVLVAVVALVLAAGFAALALRRDEPAWWIGTVFFATIGVTHLWATRDGRTPMFVADEQGIRLRAGTEWIGLLWNELGDIRVERRMGVRHDPRVKVATSV